MYDYNALTNNLVSNGTIPQADIYDYSNDELAIIFERYFQYCQKALSENSQDYGIQPSTLYFRNDFSVNAAAGKIQDHYIVRVHMGLIVTLYNKFYAENDLFDQDESKEIYKVLASSFDVPIGYVMFQLATYLTFYHEQAHLIQRSPLLTSFLTEYNAAPNPSNYSSLKHSLEFDADLHASHCLIFVLKAFWQKLPSQYHTIEYASELLALALGSAFTYMMYLEEGYSNIYYKQGTHPHPIIRITYMLDAMMRIAEINFDGIKLDTNKILSQGFKIASAYCEIGLQRDMVEAYASMLSSEYPKIENFINTVLIPESDSIPYLVKNR
ncbi:hypothetical protein [Pedobacter sp.]